MYVMSGSSSTPQNRRLSKSDNFIIAVQALEIPFQMHQVAPEKQQNTTSPLKIPRFELIKG